MQLNDSSFRKVKNRFSIALNIEVKLAIILNLMYLKITIKSKKYELSNLLKFFRSFYS